MSYVSRIFSLMTLAPNIADATLDDELPNHITLFELTIDLPVLWAQQRLISLTNFGLPLSGNRVF